MNVAVLSSGDGSARGLRLRGALLLSLLAFLLFPALAGAATGAREQRELSPRLARLASPALSDLSPARQAASLGIPRSGPGSLQREGDRVLVKLRFARGAIAGFDQLREAGARIVSASRPFQTVTVSVLPEALPELTEVPGVRAVWESQTPIVYGASASAVGVEACEGGSVISEGLNHLQVGEAREKYGVRGKGVTVGVLSDSYDVAAGAATHAAGDVAGAELPGAANPCSGQGAPVRVLAEGTSSSGHDEGRAMLQIVHDLAPHAGLAFATAFQSEELFAHNIETLAKPVAAGGAGANVIVDDVVWFEEPFFQDGPVASAVDKVSGEGVTYLSAAGNDNLFQNVNESVEGEPGIASWEAPEYRDSGECPAGLVAFSEELENEHEIALNASHCMDFDPAEPQVDTDFGITVSAGATLLLDLQWAEPWNQVTTDLDAFLLNEGGQVIKSATRNNAGKAGTQRPYELLQWENNSGVAKKVNLAINKYSGGTPRLKFILLQNGSGVKSTEYPKSIGEDVVGPTVFGHAAASGAIAVGAIRYDNTGEPERFSSRGPVTHYFEPANGITPGAPLGAPETIPKPDLVATDCGVTTFFASPEGAAWRFCGTSAAAPHAAAVAALLLQANPGATPEEIRSALTGSALPVGSFGSEAVGAGRLDALAALKAIPPASAIDDPPSTLLPPVSEEPKVEPAVAPATVILRHPPHRVRSRQRFPVLVFQFGSNQAGVTFLCKVDRGAFRVCRSPFARRFGAGGHHVTVKARGASGLLDATPASFSFRVVRVR